MRSTFKVLFYVNGSKEKNGIVPIMGRVTINGSVAQFSVTIRNQLSYAGKKISRVIREIFCNNKEASA